LFLSSYIDKNNFQKRYESMLRRISYLSSLRKEVGLTTTENIDENQWSAIQLPLFEVENRLKTILKVHARKYLPFLHLPRVARRMNALLGRIELDISNSIVFFDTYMDILSQRKMPTLGKILKGCDILAGDAMSIDHPLIRDLELPIVSCERGFGAMIIRPGVTFPGNIKNPVPLIQIPYSRIVSKYDLTSINHEAGHDIMIRLGLNYSLPASLRTVLMNSQAPKEIIDLFVLWSSEIGPDFWGFCCSGIAQTLSIKEMLSLPPYRVFYITHDDPHPAIYIRVLLSIEWCRQQWGRGEWDYWEKEWDTLYPLKFTSKTNAEILKKCRMYIPIVAGALLNTRFSSLEGKKITELFDMSVLHPQNLERIVRTAETGTLDLKATRPCVQLAVFRLLRHQRKNSEVFIDRIMTNWLIKLGQARKVTMSGLSSIS
jgi:hypothetical protein